MLHPVGRPAEGHSDHQLIVAPIRGEGEQFPVVHRHALGLRRDAGHCNGFWWRAADCQPGKSSMPHRPKIEAQSLHAQRIIVREKLMNPPRGEVFDHFGRERSWCPFGEKPTSVTHKELAVGNEHSDTGASDRIVRGSQRHGDLVFEAARLPVHQFAEVIGDASGRDLAPQIVRQAEAEMPSRSTPDQVRHERHHYAAHVARACSTGPTQAVGYADFFAGSRP
nr:hypothetical protein [Xanthobacter sp. 126]